MTYFCSLFVCFVTNFIGIVLIEDSECRFEAFLVFLMHYIRKFRSFLEIPLKLIMSISLKQVIITLKIMTLTKIDKLTVAIVKQ